ncbi:HAMP domain-containing protein [Halobaculum magnesiiphilum]|uniref:histidine kinase n=1 Tax=Halobaculum magnesiiphilum TaxID=1017351 RepID=A0A8T8WIQ3_9EURY|nr:HAMP domain-containing protein [Halobaculum magnesiiphilum]QZP39676.1 hypothetical protein K6T50_16975 [Halobaculum magnesiiphilum]
MRESIRSVPGIRHVVGLVRASYRRKLATALITVLVIVGVVILGLYVQLGAVLDENVERSMTAAADAEAGELAEWNGQNRLVTRVVSADSVFANGSDHAVRGYLLKQRADTKETRIVDVYVIDRRSLTVEVDADRELEGTAVRSLPWEEEFAFDGFEDVRTTEPYRSSNGTTVIGYLTPIRHNPGHVLVVTIDTSGVFERFDHPVDGGFTRVVDSNGTVVFADDRSATLRQYRDQVLRAPVVNSGLDGENGFVRSSTYRGPDGRGEYVAAYAPVANTDWVVIEHAPAAEAYAITRRARTWIGVVGLIAVGGVSTVILVLGADVTSALSSLGTRTKELERGNYDVRFDTERRDEFGDLNRRLASTRDTLNRQFEEIQATKRALEASNEELAERSTMIDVLNRVLRHNVRNDVNVIAGRVRSVAEDVDDEQTRAELEKVHETAWALATLSDRTKRIKNLVAAGDAERRSIDIAAKLSVEFDGLRAAWPDSAVVLEVDDSSPTVAGVPTLPTAVADVVEEVIEHNDGRVEIEVEITRESTDGPDRNPNGSGRNPVVLEVTDNRDGLPDMDAEAVMRGEVTPKKHAEGLALWCLEWTVNKSDGDLVVDTDDSTFEIQLPQPTEAAAKPVNSE